MRSFVTLCSAALLLAASLASPALADDDEARRAAVLAAYPGLFVFDGGDLVWKDGTRMIWDDGNERSPEELIANPDIEDMFTYRYPLAADGDLTPAAGFDPGRIRNEAFFKKLYGDTAATVQSRLTAVEWAGGSVVQVTTASGVDKALEGVAADLEALGPAFEKYLVAPGGGFNWRVIAGTTQLSVHSFGAALDINTEYADYWRWAGATGDGPIPYKNRIPLEIVGVFEKHGFIWGGRWYHYDTMHFEYRPELLIYAQTD